MERNKIENENTVKNLVSIGMAFIITAFSLALVSFIYKIWEFEWLKRFFTQDTVIHPASSLSYLLLAVSIWLIRKEKPAHITTYISNIVAIIPFLLGLIRTTFSILFESHVLGRYYFGSIITAIVIILTSTSIWLINYSKKDLYILAQLLNYITSLFGLIALYSFVYDIDDLQAYVTHVPFSIQSAVCTLLLSSGILFLRPHRGTMRTLIGENVTDIVLLRFLVFLTPLMLGWLKIEGTKQQWFAKEFGTALYATIAFSISMALLGWKSYIQARLKLTKYRIEKRIKDSREQMKRILDLSPATISIMDIEKKEFVFVNKASRNTYIINGHSLKNTKYKDMVDNLVVEKDQEKAIKRYKEFAHFKKEDTNTITYRVKGKKDKINWVISEAAVFKYNKNNPKQIIFNTLNITKLKELEKKLEESNKEIEEKNEELEKVNQELSDLNKNLEKEVEKIIEELKESRRASKDFFENSYEGIIRYTLKGIDGIDTSLPAEEQIALIHKHAVVGEVNKAHAKIHGYDDPEEIIGLPMTELQGMKEEYMMRLMSSFIKDNYRLSNYTNHDKTKDGSRVKLKSNIIGIIEDDKLIGAWATDIPVE